MPPFCSVSRDQNSQPANVSLIASAAFLPPVLNRMRLCLRLILVWDDSSTGRGPAVKDPD